MLLMGAARRRKRIEMTAKKGLIVQI